MNSQLAGTKRSRGISPYSVREANIKSEQQRRAVNVSIVTYLVAVQGCLCALLVYTYHSFDITNEIPLHVVGFLIFLYSYLVISKFSPRGFTSVSALYFVALSAFHLGFTLPYEFGYRTSEQVSLSWLLWYGSWLTPKAVFIVLIALSAYTLGFLIVQSLNTSASLPQPVPAKNSYTEDTEFQRQLNYYLSVVSGILLFGGMFMWFATLFLAGGLSIFFASYHDYLRIASGTQLTNYAYLFISIGMPLLLCTRHSALRTRGMLLFGAWAVLAFAMGLRGEVMFPAVACLAILARQGTKFKFRYLIIAALILLTCISAVREIRDVGISNARVSQLLSGPADGLIELGASLRPVVVVMQWEDEGEGYLYGESYLAPFERTFLKFFPLKERISGIEDERLLNVLVQQRVGPIGFSPVAEAYRNFGPLGVLVVFALFGALFARLDNTPNTITNNAYVAVLMVPLLVYVRNAFAQVPVQTIIGFVCFYAAWFLAKTKRGYVDPRFSHRRTHRVRRSSRRY